jgi:hypothetical protein
MFESPSLDAEMTDDAVQPSTSEVQSQVSKIPTPKKMLIVSTIHFLIFCVAVNSSFVQNNLIPRGKKCGMQHIVFYLYGKEYFVFMTT